jgi:hypothetical protein
VSLAFDSEAIPDRGGLMLGRQPVEMQAAFVVTILCEPTERELAFDVGPSADRFIRADAIGEASRAISNASRCVRSLMVAGK